MSKNEIMKSLEIAKAYDEAAYHDAFSETHHLLYNEEEFKKACVTYNQESEGALTMNLIEGDIVIEMDEEVYCESVDFITVKFKPLFTMIKAIIDFCESLSDDLDEFFEGIINKRKLTRLEKENEELQAQVAAAKANSRRYSKGKKNHKK